jgi:H+-transporting ATPase
LSFDKPYLAKKGNSNPATITEINYTEEELLLYAYLASEPGATDAIEFATRRGAEETLSILKEREKGSIEIPGYKVVSFVPFNPVSKYTEATAVEKKTNEKFRCVKGAPQVIIALCNNHREATKKVEKFASQGLRALGVAKTVDPEMKKFEMIGLISLIDPPRVDSAHTIKECMKLGIQVYFTLVFMFRSK